MPTVLDTLKAISAYPIPQATLASVAAARGLDLYAEVSEDDFKEASYRLARADVLIWLSCAPNIAQGGQNYSFNEEQRKQLRGEAMAIYGELEQDTKRTVYGYKGSRL